MSIYLEWGRRPLHGRKVLTLSKARDSKRDADDFEVLRVTTAYEQGFGHAHRKLENPYVEGSKEFTAWAIGKREGERRAQPPPASAAGLEEAIAKLRRYADGNRYIDHHLSILLADYRALQAQPVGVVTAEWVAMVKRKFKLPLPDNKQEEYWRGYTACLEDVERRLAARPRADGRCPNDNDSDGNCGRKTCQRCYPQFQSRADGGDREERMEAVLGQWLMSRWEHEDGEMPIPKMIEWALCGGIAMGKETDV